MIRHQVHATPDDCASTARQAPAEDRLGDRVSEADRDLVRCESSHTTRSDRRCDSTLSEAYEVAQVHLAQRVGALLVGHVFERVGEQLLQDRRFDTLGACGLVVGDLQVVGDVA
ncbi:hypothetical protein [Burkholderia ubonensis]|uniref:Uncharacterized protein n=1 Tax=Burkholderia ubonensis TaxID=101571 RepID=A0A107GKQ7_9BURK|nr:hypothetical protein [Burkholderia ubonensis]KWD76956.1 hypothetical protein WL71_27985 [Burkholderia ubonensis]KWD91436.1 hypothetical protein WL70_02785 [Burkholderia ubonensis]KWD93671.1 hypothetical protein WL72_26610 [Burkholderia ubonensis]KWE13682.1 hypothetical protein WL73_30530 [Burkholderia ubonensis]